MARGVDVGRLSAAVERPGIDPRHWCMVAVVTAFVVDPEHGPFVDVTIIPSGETETARVGSIYAGNGFGFYAPLKIDDEVIVGYPNGEPSAGLVVLARTWSKPDPPPGETVVGGNPSPDVMLFIEKDVNLRLVVDGMGSIVLDPRGSGKVGVGGVVGSAGMEPMVLGQQLQNLIAQQKADFDAHTHLSALPGVPTGIASVSIPPITFPTANVLATKGELK